MRKKPVIHWSHLSSLYRCGVSFHKKFILQTPESPGTGLVVGSSSHEAAEANLDFKIKNGRLLPIETCKSIATMALEKRWPTVHFNNKEVAKGVDVVKAECLEKTIQLVDLFYNELMPQINAVAVEKPWKIECVDRPYDISGTWDLICADFDGKDELWDFKNVAKSPGANQSHADDQASIYLLAYYVKHGRIPTYKRVSLVKTKKPKIVIQPTTRTIEDFQVLMNRVDAAWRTIESGTYLPAAQDSWICSTSFCSFAAAGQCEFFRPSSAPAIEGDEDGK